MTTLAERMADAGVRLKSYESGGQRIPCPQCSSQRTKKTDPCLSVTIDEDGAKWKCHHCNWGGGVKDREDDPSPAPSRRAQLDRQADRAKWPAVTSMMPWAAEYLSGRGLPLELLTWAGVGVARAYYPERGERSSIAFCYREAGKPDVVNIKFRTVEKDFTQSKGGKAVFYLIDKVDREHGDRLVIAEGEIDALSLWQAGIENAISVPNGAPQKVSDKPIDPERDKAFGYVWEARELLAGFSKVVLACDSDANGAALTEELARRIGREKCWLIDWPEGCKDANDVLLRHGAEKVRECIDKARPHPIQGLFSVDDFADGVRAMFAGVRKPAFSTGWPTIDALYKIREAELSVVTGWHHCGKSEYIDATAMNMARLHNWHFAFCSFENPQEEHIIKLAEKYVGKPFDPGPTERMTPTDLDLALDWLGERVWFMKAEEESPTIEWILERAAGAVMRYGTRGLVIDPYNEIEHRRPPNMMETEYVSQMLGKVKRFIMSRGVHCWFVAHPAKPFKLKDGSPAPLTSLYDISGSANWGNKADIGVIVGRREEDGIQYADIDVKKVRFKQTGRTGKASLIYDRVTGQYREPARGQEAMF
jgi:twinkle protein